jgi:hypothetical protein
MPKRTDISKILIRDVRSVAISVYFLFMTTGALGECVSVQQNYERSSSSNVRVTAIREKKVLKDVKIEFHSSQKHGGFSLSTNDAGVVILPALKPGKQCITATAPDGEEADLCLDVSPNIKEKSRAFSIELPPTLAEQELATAESMPVGDRIQEFRGAYKIPRDRELRAPRLKSFGRGHQIRPTQSRLRLTRTEISRHI